THTMQDLDILNSRDKIPFKVDEEVRQSHKDTILPFWKGRNLRERIFKELDEEWIDAYEAGIFTEFQEQRAPGHTVLDEKIYMKGMQDFIADIERSIDNLDFYSDAQAFEKKEELKAMRIAANALMKFADRYADYADELAEKTKQDGRKSELRRIAKICRRVPRKKPENFWEALQYYWFVHLGVITEYNTWDSFNPGRLDQHLYPFYKKGLEDRTLTRKKAKELLQAFWVKFNNQPAPPKVGVTAEESNTYTDFCLINLGGVNPEGEDAVNELTYLILDVIQEMRILQPSSMIQVSKKNPDRFIKRALEIIKTGFGQPSVFNTDELIKELLRQGKDIIDARNGGCSGCVETGAFGKESYILTGYFNFAKILEITLNNGRDPETNKKIGLETGKPTGFDNFDQLLDAYKKQLHYFIDIKIKGNRLIERFWANYLPTPFLSLLIDDCIANGQDYNSGGARYNTSYIQGVGTGTVTDSLTALKYHVFDKMNIGMQEFLHALQSNFEGYDQFRKQLLEDTPKYGNDNDYADDILREIFVIFYNSVEGRKNTKGGRFRINLLPTTSHIYFGSKTGATPDGRKSHLPLSEGISPVQGADRNGPTAVLKSAAKLDHVRTGGTLLNQKFTPSFFESEKAINSIVNLIRAYFKMDGHHIQFNVVGAETLRKAQKNPENYKNLIVRVAGYSDYFVDLTEELQNEIIARTEQGGA
ncbi:MAG: formate C-acetyltransferase/glycerol dehydratase family glycyl radical enzyme, partial [Candidatus Marinimicrobia bacterium]|nr:formate C-acetyltransferase/glycerol dehydratase family glycyl radical enzyme [Candidatus Neomarinimicrobiota bacterium]